jgi:fructose-1,6-bisphosphatase/inositol monophosphatase family enzyme
VTAAPDPLRVADAIRTVAAEEILPRFNKLEKRDISEKQSGEIVTAADVASEQRLTAALTAILPGSVVVGEEGFAADPACVAHFSRSLPVWVIDPVDGTRNFAEGKAIFGVIVALVEGGTTRMGWIYDPLGDDMMWGMRGEGAWDATGRLALGPAPRLAAMRGSVAKRPRDRLAQMAAEGYGPVPREMLRYRCVAREYMELVRGHLDFAVYGQLKPWDHAAGVLLYAEAGGHGAYAADGAPYVPGPMTDSRYILARDEARWRELRDLIQAALASPRRSRLRRRNLPGALCRRLRRRCAHGRSRAQLERQHRSAGA